MLLFNDYTYFRFLVVLSLKFPLRKFIFASIVQDVVKLRYQTNRSDLILPVQVAAHAN